MSGGSLDYAYMKIDSIIYDFNCRFRGLKLPKEYTKFKQHLKQVSQVLHDIEWAESGDTDEESGKESINKFFGGLKK